MVYFVKAYFKQVFNLVLVLVIESFKLEAIDNTTNFKEEKEVEINFSFDFRYPKVQDVDIILATFMDINWTMEAIRKDIMEVQDLRITFQKAFVMVISLII